MPEKLVELIGQPRVLVDKALDWLFQKAIALGKSALQALGLGGKDEEPDTRTTEEKAADLKLGMADAYALINKPDSAVDTVTGALPGLVKKYRLQSLDLVVDKEDGLIKTVHVLGKVNPEDEGPKVEMSGERKKGDHVFAVGMRKGVDKWVGLCTKIVGDTPEAVRLVTGLQDARKLLDDPVFDLVIDKGAQPAKGDTHSTTFGEIDGDVTTRMQAFFTAVQVRAQKITDRTQVEANQQFVQNAADQVFLLLGDWATKALDPDAEKLMPKAKADIDKGRKLVAQFRDSVSAVLKNA